MHRTHIFLAGLIAVAAILFSGLFGAISQGPPGLSLLTHNLMPSAPSGFVVAIMASTVALLLVEALASAFKDKSSTGGRLRRSPLALLMWTMAGKSRVMYRAMRMFFMPHVHSSRLQTVSAQR